MNLDKITKTIETLNDRPQRTITLYHILCSALILGNVLAIGLILLMCVEPVKVSKQMKPNTTIYKYERDNELHK